MLKSLNKAYYGANDMLHAFEELEYSIACDPNDKDYYIYIAGLICDEKIARIPGNDTPCAIKPTETEQYAAPYLLALFKRSPQEYAEEILRFFKRNNFTRSFERLISYLQNPDEDFFNVFANYNFDAVLYCYNLMGN